MKTKNQNKNERNQSVGTSFSKELKGGNLENEYTTKINEKGTDSS